MAAVPAPASYAWFGMGTILFSGTYYAIVKIVNTRSVLPVKMEDRRERGSCEGPGMYAQLSAMMHICLCCDGVVCCGVGYFQSGHHRIDGYRHQHQGKLLSVAPTPRQPCLAIAVLRS